jgi:hypothetical protein
MPIKYHIHLSTQERQELESFIRAGESSVRTQTLAWILLLCVTKARTRRKQPKKFHQRKSLDYKKYGNGNEKVMKV